MNTKSASCRRLKVHSGRVRERSSSGLDRTGQGRASPAAQDYSAFSLLKGITADEKIIQHFVQLIMLNNLSKFYKLEQIW